MVKKSAQLDRRLRVFFIVFFAFFFTSLVKWPKKTPKKSHNFWTVGPIELVFSPSLLEFYGPNERRIASHLKHFSNLTCNGIFEILDPSYGGFQYFFDFFFAFSSMIYIGAVSKPVASMPGHKNHWLSTPKVSQHLVCILPAYSIHSNSKLRGPCLNMSNMEKKRIHDLRFTIAELSPD